MACSARLTCFLRPRVSLILASSSPKQSLGFFPEVPHCHSLEKDYSVSWTGGRNPSGPCIPLSKLYPTAAILHAFSFTPPAADSQDFNWVEAPTSKSRVFTYNQFLCKLRDHLALIGNNPTLYAGHSFRRGGVSVAYQSGVLIEPIKALGDWRSDTILIYTSPCL